MSVEVLSKMPFQINVTSTPSSARNLSCIQTLLIEGTDYMEIDGGDTQWLSNIMN